MFSGGPSLTARLANIKHMPVLIAATVASEKPIDSYIVKDVIKMSYESPQTRAFLHQYLLNQLITSRNVYVKWKVLKLIEGLLEKGHIEFKQNLRKQPEPLNEASRLRCSHSKDEGLVTECARIRDLANKLLEMLYSDAPEMQRKRYPSPEFRAAGDGSSGSTSTSRMEGFGNTSYVSPKTKSSSATSDKLKALFGQSGTTKTNAATTPLVYDQSYATMDPVPHNMHAGNSSIGSTVGHTPGRYLEHGLPEGAPHRTGEAGGGWGRGTPYQTTPPHHPPVVPSTSEQMVREDSDDIETAENHEDRNTEQERKLVDDITAPGGIKAAPPRDSLNRFIARCKVLDCLAVVEFLRQKLLQEEQTQVVLRALFVIEAMLKSDIADIYSYLDLVLEELNTMTHSNNTSIRAKSKKIMHQLEAVEDYQQQRVTSSNTGSGTGGNGAAQVPSGDTGTILDLGEEGGGGERQDTLDKQPTGQASSAVMAAGLFSGMSFSGQSPSGPPGMAGGENHQPRGSSSSQSAGGQPETVAASYGDLLGLQPGSDDATPPSSNQQSASVAATGEEVSLMDLGAGEDDDKDNFDPLTRTESVGSKSNSLTRSLSLGNVPTATPPTSDDIMSQLSGLDLVSQTNSSAQNGIGTNTSEIMQPFSLDLSHVPTSSTSHAPTSNLAPLLPGMTSSHHVVVGGAPGSNANFRSTQMTSQLSYVPVVPIPYGMQTVHGSAGQQGLYVAAPGPTMYMNQPRLGGDSRPVQRPPQVSETAAESSFDFLGKSSKGSAFDFVKAEIDSAKKK